ncbi:MAG: aldo/keto reductase [Xanthomonadales bacterium]|nr:aldo/keto reductase [Xanthomonadales bacterium]
MTTRRQFLKTGLAAGTALALGPAWLHAAGSTAGALITRAIPASGERLPVIGLGSSATFAQVARQEDVSALGAVLNRMIELGGTVFDTAPGYGSSEEVAGRLARELDITDRLFWATKLNVAPRGGGKADSKAARAQLATSLERIGKRPLDLVQVHNMGDLATQLPILREAKAAGKIRYLGITTTFPAQYEGLLRAMRKEPLDFIGTNYAIDDRDAEKTFLPLAKERGIAVLVYAPFGRTRLWKRVAGRPLPDWAAEFDAQSWAQFFLKFVASHPDVTAITPATSKPANMADNFGAARGRLPDTAMRKRMVELVESLPA